jgi:hypothetical protein
MRWLLAIVALIPAMARAEVGTYNLPGKPPYLVGHYMLWYSAPWGHANSVGDATDKQWSHWKWKGGQADHDPERRLPNGQRDIASVLYPLIGVYDSGSRAVMRYHLATMKAAGVSAVTLIWYGEGSTTDSRVPMFLDEAEKLDMRVAIMYEEKINFPGYRHPKDRDEMLRNATKDMQYIITKYGNHPAYLKRNGLPVIAQFNATGADEIGPHKLTPDEFSDIFATLPTKVAYIRQNMQEIYHPLLKGAYVWWAQDDWPKKFAEKCVKLRSEGKLEFFMTTVCPGFDDTGVWGWGNGPRKSRGYGLDILKWTEDQALVGDPELVQLVTWNDFNESTCFEPTVQHGFEWLDQLETWWGQATGHPVDLKDNRAAFEEYKKTCSDTEKSEIPTERSP